MHEPFGAVSVRRRLYKSVGCSHSVGVHDRNSRLTQDGFSSRRAGNIWFFATDDQHFYANSGMHRILLLYSIIVLSISGCGTMANLQGQEHLFISPPGVRKPQIYGGVSRHIELVQGIAKMYSENARSIDPGFHDYSSLTYLLPFVAAFTAIDTPVSAAADTLSIPIVIHKRQHWKKAETKVLDADAGGTQHGTNTAAFGTPSQ